MSEVDRRSYIIEALYKDAAILGTIQGDDFALVLFKNDLQHNGAKRLDHAVRSLTQYYPQQAAHISTEQNIPGFVGLWMPARIKDEQGTSTNLPEFDYLEKAAKAGRVSYVQDARDLGDFTEQLGKTIARQPVTAGIAGMVL